MAATIPHLPILRRGEVYESLDAVTLVDHRDGTPLATVSQANAGIIRRDLRLANTLPDPFDGLSCADMLDISVRAGELFMTGDLPWGLHGEKQSADEYVRVLSATSGLPYTLCRRNMEKINTVFTGMPVIVDGLTRGLDHGVFDEGAIVQDGLPLSYTCLTNALGVVLPSNSPGTNSIWMPALALKVPVILKPGRDEPWTPLRIMQAFIAAGCPASAFGFYPTDHEGSATIMERCNRALIFGDDKTVDRYRHDASVQVHGPGRSKIVIGGDILPGWRDHVDVIVDSIVANGGRSCINASCVLTAGNAEDIAGTLARELATKGPCANDDPAAMLSAHANSDMAAMIDRMIDAALLEPGAEDVTARYRSGPRLVTHAGATYLLPTVIRCDDPDHRLANIEFMFPFVSVVAMPQEEMIDWMGPTLVGTALTRDADLREQLLADPGIDRLNLGPVPTTRVDWNQPHEGNLFEFLYARRAIQEAAW